MSVDSLNRLEKNSSLDKEKIACLSADPALRRW